MGAATGNPETAPFKLYHVRESVLNQWPDSDVFVPDLPFRRFSMADPIVVTAWLLREIDRRWNERRESGGTYSRITLVGHSLGALLARKAYVFACGETL